MRKPYRIAYRVRCESVKKIYRELSKMSDRIQSHTQRYRRDDTESIRDLRRNKSYVVDITI